MKEEKWELRKKVEGEKMTLAEEILRKRGFEEKEVESFLNPKLKDLKNPYVLENMDKVVGRIMKAINLKESILVYGDYDTDGITATASLVKFLRDKGGDVDYYIPNRLEEGYGMDKEKIKELATKFSLIITVDNGITAVDEINVANSLGSDVIVIDHHTPNEQLPNAHSIINPDNDLAGVGLILKTIQALGGNIEEYLAITSLGTIGDMVKLRNENRIIAKKGLKNFKGFNLNILAESLKKEEPTGQDISFYLSPAINSCGRLGNSDLAVDFLLEEDKDKARKKAKKIVEMNDERRERSKKIMKRIEKVVSDEVSNDNFFFVALEDAHKGVIGSSASKLMYKHFKPVFLLSKEKEYSTGSVRVPDDISFNVVEFLQSNSALFEKSGGHENAGGFKIDNDFLPVLKKKLKKATSHLTSKDFEKEIVIDKKLEVNDIDRDVVKELEKLAPFGEGNPEPIFGAKNLKVKSSFTISNDSHVMGKFETEEGKMDFVAWGMGNQLDKFRTSELAVVYVPEINTYRGGNSLRMKIESAKNLTSVEDKKDKGRSFYTKLTGVTYGNRQEVIKKEVSIGDEISLKRDFENNYDENATYVLVGGEEIGYLRAELAKNIAPKLDKGIKYTGEVVNITGQNYKNRGVNIKLKEIS